jgi:hypothetical protein
MKMRLTETESRNCYRAAYNGFDRGFAEGQFDIVMASDGDARPISSGCALPDHAVIFRNVSESDFGQWDRAETTEDEFVDLCMDAYGRIEREE